MYLAGAYGDATKKSRVVVPPLQAVVGASETPADGAPQTAVADPLSAPSAGASPNKRSDLYQYLTQHGVRAPVYAACLLAAPRMALSGLLLYDRTALGALQRAEVDWTVSHHACQAGLPPQQAHMVAWWNGGALGAWLGGLRCCAICGPTRPGPHTHVAWA